MSDHDARNGYRALISGGAYGLGDEEVKSLSSALAQAQRDRGQIPSVDEVTYLQQYLAICEEHISTVANRGDFDPSIEVSTKLQELNTKYPKISESVRKTEIIASGLDVALRDEGWMSSSYSC